MRSISTGTIIRTICLALALLNQILTATGHSIIPIDDETVQVLVSTVATVITALVAWWKNNSFTGAAIEGDMLMHELKSHPLEDIAFDAEADEAREDIEVRG